MRTRQMFLALTMVAACSGVEGPVLYSNDAALPGTGGSSVGTGGAVGTGGRAIGAGGAIIGVGGSKLGTGGHAIGAGGAIIGVGGSKLGTGGRATGMGGSATGRGGATSTGGSVIGSGGLSLGLGGAAGGSGGSTPDAGGSCSSWTTLGTCENAGCMPFMGVADGVSQVAMFLGCSEKVSCPAVMAAAYPPGEPNHCYGFQNGCVPPGWIAASGGTCPTAELVPTITAVSLYLNCMPGGPSGTDALMGSFKVEYENPSSEAPGVLTLTSVSLSFTNMEIRSIPLAVIPTDSGIVAPGERVTVTHQKDPNSASGLGCICSTSSVSVMLDVTWETGKQLDKKTISASFGPATVSCVF